MAFPPAGRELDSFPVLIKFIDLAALGKPFPTRIHCPHGQHDMGVWVSVPFVMDGKIHAHSFGNKLLAAEIPYKGGVLDVYKRQSRYFMSVSVRAVLSL